MTLACLLILTLVLIATHIAHLRQTTATQLAHERERQQWADERTTLLNRIKPETAQPVRMDHVPSPPAVNPFLDEDYWESKEALADRLAAQETGASR